MIVGSLQRDDWAALRCRGDERIWYLPAFLQIQLHRVTASFQSHHKNTFMVHRNRGLIVEGSTLRDA